jgi:hypothetical protein
MHASKLASEGIRYLDDLQINELYQLQEELDVLWNSGQANISNGLYDKVVDGINYEISQLSSDPYNFVLKKTDSELKNIVDYFGQLYSQGKSRIVDAIWDILHQELVLRNNVITDLNITFPSHWTAVSERESTVQLITLPRLSQEFQDISDYFIKSLGQTSTVVYSITRIQNVRLWNIHQQLQRTIRCESTRLIHGTASLRQQKSIIYHGFYGSYCPNGTIGDGVYFALRASYSNNDPYVMRKTAHRRELFICQVLLGKTTLGRNGLKSTPPDYHAVHFSNYNEIDEFCIFNHYQAYPEYIVQYDYE